MGTSSALPLHLHFMCTYKDVSKPHSFAGMLGCVKHRELVQWNMRNAYTDSVEDQLVKAPRCQSTRQT